MVLTTQPHIDEDAEPRMPRTELRTTRTESRRSRRGSGSEIDSESVTTARARGLERLRPKWSIRLMLMLFISVQLVVLSSVIWGANFHYGRQAVEVLTQQIVSQGMLRVLEILKSFNSLPHMVQQQIEFAFLHDVLSVEDEKAVRRSLWAKLGAMNVPISVLIGLEESGQVLGYTRSPTGNYTYYALSDKGYARYAIDLQTGEPTALVNSSSTYDVRTRIWYQAAKDAGESVVTPLYVSQASPEVIRAVSSPLYNSSEGFIGVISVSSSVTMLQNQVNSISFCPHGKIFMLDSDGYLYAVSGTESVVKPNSTDLYLGTEFVDGYVRRAVQEHMARLSSGRWIINSQIQYTYDGTTQLMQVTMQNDTVVGVVCPQTDYTSSIAMSSKVIVAVFLSALLFSILMVAVIANGITRPIRNLTCRMQKEARLQSSKNTNLSHIYDVKYLESSFCRLCKALYSFAKYVPFEVVRSLLLRNSEAELGMESSEITILFSDIEDFTAIAEKLDSDILAQMIEAYFEKLSEIFIGSGGIIDKFIGDAMMVLWNTPIYQLLDHPQAACTAALHCHKWLLSQNMIWAQKNFPKFVSRFGIHSGTALVGNMGTQSRMSYTAVGTTVNVANYLEGLNKQYGTHVLISESVYVKVKGSFLCRWLETVKVQQGASPMRVYEVVDFIKEASPQQFEMVYVYESALQLFYRGEYRAAAIILEFARQRTPPLHLDVAANILLRRCRYCSSIPPSANCTPLQ